MNNVIAGKILQIIESPEFYEVEKQWALERESILQKGKKARNEGKKIEMWAELEGFDRAIQKLHSIAQYREPEIPQYEE